MTRFSAWRHDVVDLLRKPLNKDAYRVLGIVGMIGVLLAATIVFVAVPRWEVALIAAILAIPGSLFAGVLCILWRQQHGAAKRPDILWVVSVLAIVIVSSGASFRLQDTIPSVLVRTIVIAVAGAVMLCALACLQIRIKGKL